MKYIFLTLNWLFGVLFVLIGLAFLQDDPLSVLFLFAIAALLLPPTRNFVYSKTKKKLPTKLRAAVIFVLLITFWYFHTESILRQYEAKEQIIQKEKEIVELAAQSRRDNIDFFNTNREQIISSSQAALEAKEYQSVISQTSKYLVSEDQQLTQIYSEAKSSFAEISQAKKDKLAEMKKAEKAEPIGITANSFSIKTDFGSGQLNLSVETDLPDNTEVSVSVGRTYKEKGNTSDYSLDYFSEKGTVGQWRSPKKIKVDNTQWNNDLRKKQKEMSRIGLGFDVAGINAHINIRMVVPINQKDPRFGKRNEHLSGAAVRKDGIRVVEDEIDIAYPISAKITETLQVSLDPLNLTIGQVYLVSRTTPLMSSPSPSDPMAALEKAKKIAAGGGFKVMDVKAQDGRPWYLVALVDTTTDQVVKGWINSTALIGQNLDTP